MGAGRDEITTGLPIFFSSPSRFQAVGPIWRKPTTSVKSSPIRYSRPLRSPLRLMRRAFSRKTISEIEIAWNAVLGATHYKLYRSATSDGLFAQVEGDISITRYRDGGLSANIYYYYQLEACSGDECSERSPTARTAPDAPTDSDTKRQRDFNHMERDCGRDALQIVSGDGERRSIYANWRRHRRATGYLDGDLSEDNSLIIINWRSATAAGVRVVRPKFRPRPTRPALWALVATR